MRYFLLEGTSGQLVFSLEGGRLQTEILSLGETLYSSRKSLETNDRGRLFEESEEIAEATLLFFSCGECPFPGFEDLCDVFRVEFSESLE